LDCVYRFFQVGACYHEFLASSVKSALKNVLKVIFMGLFAVVYSSKNRIAKVDSNLEEYLV